MALTQMSVMAAALRVYRAKYFGRKGLLNFPTHRSEGAIEDLNTTKTESDEIMPMKNCHISKLIRDLRKENEKREQTLRNFMEEIEKRQEAMHNIMMKIQKFCYLTYH